MFLNFKRFKIILLITAFSLVFQSAFFSKRERNGIEAKLKGPKNFLSTWECHGSVVGGLRTPGRAGFSLMR